MKFLSFFLIFFFSYFCGQTHRFLYNLEYKSDSLQADWQKKTMVLDINPKDVKYYDYSFLIKDSINKRTNSQNINWTDQIPVTRKRNSNQNLNYNALNFDIYTYVTEDNMSWNLHKDTQEYNGLKLQKATCNFGGRNWTAWFTKDIPINEGPYKFRGLPGMIVLLQDEKNRFRFVLAENKNLNETYDTSNILEVRYGHKPFPTTEKMFVKKSIEYFNDPFHDVKASLASNPSGSFDLYGKRYTKDDDLTMVSREAQQKILNKNNPIELNKIIKYKKK